MGDVQHLSVFLNPQYYILMFVTMTALTVTRCSYYLVRSHDFLTSMLKIVFFCSVVLGSVICCVYL
ncbi:hypothetical protein JVT61DRAFT_11285 [Boletus reticuloceps]|uniref:Uncharacterized protein n=1 Tax=Boletus reticuloceps TaxID=495285 RepID=A0A8I2YEZ5_9AGAM|nr:hypothetical protein JVT61DRAFT_11285 [Boletus reticuloceps]